MPGAAGYGTLREPGIGDSLRSILLRFQPPCTPSTGHRMSRRRGCHRRVGFFCRSSDGAESREGRAGQRLCRLPPRRLRREHPQLGEWGRGSWPGSALRMDASLRPAPSLVWPGQGPQSPLRCLRSMELYVSTPGLNCLFDPCKDIDAVGKSTCDKACVSAPPWL